MLDRSPDGTSIHAGFENWTDYYHTFGKFSITTPNKHLWTNGSNLYNIISNISPERSPCNFTHLEKTKRQYLTSLECLTKALSFQVHKDEVPLLVRMVQTNPHKNFQRTYGIWQSPLSTYLHSYSNSDWPKPLKILQDNNKVPPITYATLRWSDMSTTWLLGSKQVNKYAKHQPVGCSFF